MKKTLELTLDNIPLVANIAKALSSEIRLGILKLLDTQHLNISEIAQSLQIPISTAALHIKVLESAGLVISQPQPGIRGSQKVSGIKVEKIFIDIKPVEDPSNRIQTLATHMPIGNYSDFNIVAPCGIASDKLSLCPDDELHGFFSPDRHNAQILWFYKGFLEYRFSNHQLHLTNNLISVDFSFEVCSEAPGYNNDWPSDITLWINNQEVCTFTSSGDYGGRRGNLTPGWWPDNLTQFGLLRTLSISPNGCYLDNNFVSPHTIKSLALHENNYVSLRIGIKDDAKYVGGLNLFGEKFGDFEQNIIMRINYEKQ